MASVQKTVDFILAARESKTPLFIWGKAGIGKTEVPRYVAEEILGIKVVNIRAAFTDPGDWLGLPTIDPDNPEIAHFAKTSFLPKEGEGILILDEINRARMEIQNCIMQLTDKERRIEASGYVLPEGWSIIAIGNPPGGEYNVLDIEAALLSRFCHMSFNPTIDEWIEFAQKVGIRKEIISFIKENPKMLGQGVEEYIPEELVPDPRSWERFSNMCTALENDNKLQDNMVDAAIGSFGTIAAREFVNYLESGYKRIEADKILTDYDHVQKQVQDAMSKDRIPMVKEAIEELFNSKDFDIGVIISDEVKQENLFRFLIDIPLDIAYLQLEKCANEDERYSLMIEEPLTKAGHDFQKKFMQINPSEIEREDTKGDEDTP